MTRRQLDQDDLDDTEKPEEDSTLRYLSHEEESLYSEVCYRKKIDEVLMFLSCQITSTSVAWVFSSLQVSTSIMIASCIAISLIPGIVDAGESFRVELSSERWEVHHSSPLEAIAKTIVGVSVSWNSSQAIARDYWRTESNIQSVYTDVRNNNNKGWSSIPLIDTIPVLIAIGLGAAFLLIKTKGNAPKI
jgi:hypothetical protein